MEWSARQWILNNTIIICHRTRRIIWIRIRWLEAKTFLPAGTPNRFHIFNYFWRIRFFGSINSIKSILLYNLWINKGFNKMWWYFWKISFIWNNIHVSISNNTKFISSNRTNTSNRSYFTISILWRFKFTHYFNRNGYYS